MLSENQRLRKSAGFQGRFGVGLLTEKIGSRWGMFESQLFDEILSAWVAYGRRLNHQEMLSDVPRPEDLRELLEVTFLASIRQEEGRSLQFRIVFAGETSTAGAERKWPWVNPLMFAEPLPFSPATIGKIALAFDQDLSALVVARQDGKYFIVGAISYGRHISRLEIGGSLGRPPALTLSTRSPGSVIIGHSDSAVGRFIDGKFVLAKADWTGSGVLVKHIIDEISQHPEFERHKGEYWYLYRDLLERLYRTAARLGHGGTIVWVPSSKMETAIQHTSKGYVVSGRWQSGNSLAGDVLDRRKNREDGWILAENMRRLGDYIDTLSRLSTLDGAVIIDDKLVAHRFATHLNAEWAGDVFEGPLRNDLPIEKFHFTALGTRHSSAIRFAGKNPGAIVFVISEDGPVRTISRLEDAVLVWPDCLNTVFMDL